MGALKTTTTPLASQAVAGERLCGPVNATRAVCRLETYCAPPPGGCQAVSASSVAHRVLYGGFVDLIVLF